MRLSPYVKSVLLGIYEQWKFIKKESGGNDKVLIPLISFGYTIRIIKCKLNTNIEYDPATNPLFQILQNCCLL